MAFAVKTRCWSCHTLWHGTSPSPAEQGTAAHRRRAGIDVRAREGLPGGKNKFINNLTSRFQFTEALIVAYPEVPDLKAQTKRYHSNVRIEDNDFETFDVPLVHAISTDGIAFTGNRVNYNDRYKGWKKPPFTFLGCENILIRDNKVTNAPDGQKWPDEPR